MGDDLTGRAIVHKTDFQTDEGTRLCDIDVPFTTDVRISRKPGASYFTVTLVGEFSEFVGMYVKGNRGACSWVSRNTFIVEKALVDVEAFVEDALAWGQHNVFIRDDRDDRFLALKLCCY